MSYFSGLGLVSLIKTLGYLGILAITFAESGLLIGFFLPGDSLLFTAGFLASQGYLDLRWLIIIAVLGAVVGDSVGYAFGLNLGPRIFSKKDSWLFNQEYIAKTKTFYAKYGGKTLILARFMPIVRTFAPILAGVGVMRYRSFVIYNITGGILWVVSLSMLGYFLGSVVPNIDHYLIPIIALIIIISVSPTVIHIVKDKHQRAKLFNFLKTLLKYKQK